MYTVAAMTARSESMYKIFAALLLSRAFHIPSNAENSPGETFATEEMPSSLLDLYEIFDVRRSKEIPEHRHVVYGYNEIISMELSKSSLDSQSNANDIQHSALSRRTP